MNTTTVTQLDRDLDDGVLDLPPKDRPALRKLDGERPTLTSETATGTTTEPPAPKKKPAKKSASPRTSDCVGYPPPIMATTKDPRGRRIRAKKKTSRAKKLVLYSNQTPKGLMPVGTMVKYTGGAKIKNTWLKKGMVGRVFGYRPGKTGGGLYAVRFEKGTTLLSAKRVAKVAKGAQS